MNRSTTARRLLVHACAMALPLAFASTLAFAGSSTGVPKSGEPMTGRPVQLVGTVDTDPRAIREIPRGDTRLFTPASPDDGSTTFDTGASSEMSAGHGGKPFRGFCRCGCSFTPDCNTSADCGGGFCSKAPSCC